MRNIYSDICEAKKKKTKLLAVLLDPDKINFKTIDTLVEKINQSPATHIFVGGSTVAEFVLEELLFVIKKKTNLPIVLFPGSYTQISNLADAILFLSLLSGRNPEYLIEQQLKAAPILQQTTLEIIPTAYILIESGTVTAVARVSNTTPIDRNNSNLAKNTALAGQMMGAKLIYLEAGSGAQKAVPFKMISEVSKNLEIPIIVGGGIKNYQQINDAFDAGATLVVIGTAFENDRHFFDSLQIIKQN